MKLYLTTAGYHGTQAEAKSFSKDYEQVEVPTDKPGLIEFLNQLHNERSDREDEYQTVVERHDPPVETGPSSTDISIAIDDAWDDLPLARKLHFGSLALEEARELVPALKSAEPVELTKDLDDMPSETVVEVEPDDADDLLS